MNADPGPLALRRSIRHGVLAKTGAHPATIEYA
jgi:hypothetical protein